jgi:NAD(P)-dependent dehydrogenase (short-subunit alcohol dehydrogenase family)
MSTDEKKKSSVRPERPSHMRVAIVTGSNTGIGRETALGLCREGYHVVMACRNESKALAAIEYLQMECKNASAEFLALDLSSFESVRGFSKAVLKAFSEVKVLVNNAGCSPFSLGDPEQANTGEGFNPIFQINYLAPFYLTQLLLPLLEASAPARIVNLASPMHRRARVEVESFKRTARKMTKATYAVTKLGLVLMSYEMQRRLAAKGVYSVAVSPGGVYRCVCLCVNAYSCVCEYVHARMCRFMYACILMAQ